MNNIRDKFKIRVQRGNEDQYIFGISVFNLWNHVGIFFDFGFFSIVIEYYKKPHCGDWE